MANTAEGITVGDEAGLDPNDPHDFAAIMEGRGIEREEGEEVTPDRSISSGLTYADEPGTPERGPDGRFVAKEAAKTEDTPSQGTTDTSETDDGEADDPEIQAILDKYGDVDKALKALANAQSLIGRRDEDRERMAQELAELRGRLDGLTAAGVGRTAQAAPLSNEQVVEVASSRIETLGYENAASEAANHAHTSGDERAYKVIMEQWMIESPADAMDFNTDFRLWQREQRSASTETATPAWALRAEEQAKVETYGEGFKSLRDEIGQEAFALVAAQFEAALEQMPQNVLQMIDSDDAEARDAGFRIVADRALRLAQAAGVTPAAPANDTPTPASVSRKLAGARVASGALRPAEKRSDAPTNREDAIKEFKRQIVEAPTTNIASGLTYGPIP